MTTVEVVATTTRRGRRGSSTRAAELGARQWRLGHSAEVRGGRVLGRVT
jgi:hypothetical protein